MDDYTRRTRAYLEQLYAGPPPGWGEYVPHAPVQGFRPQSRYLGTYAHTYFVLQHLGRYEFASCLDVGAGEGFLGALIERIFGAKVTAVDLSLRACRRAQEARLSAVCAEALLLPFSDQSFDVVVSLNTLEHVPDVAQAYEELCRVARSVVVIGMPRARRGQQSESPQTPHAHVSLFTRRQMQLMFGPQARLCGSLSFLARTLYPLVAEDDVRSNDRYRWLGRPPWSWVYGALHTAGRVVPRHRSVAWLCRIEALLSHVLPWWTYETVIVRELAGARRRRPPLAPRVILRALLSEDPLLPLHRGPSANHRLGR